MHPSLHSIALRKTECHTCERSAGAAGVRERARSIVSVKKREREKEGEDSCGGYEVTVVEERSFSFNHTLAKHESEMGGARITERVEIAALPPEAERERMCVRGEY